MKTTVRGVFRFTFPGLLLIGLTACGGGGGSQPSISQPVSSGATPNSVPVTNPVPTISALYPSCAPAGETFINGVNNQLTVIGPYPPAGFVADSVVQWNGSDRPTTYQPNSPNGSINSVTAQISASDIAAAGTAVVTVFNPAPGGGTSNSSIFTVTTGAVNPESIVLDPTGRFAYVTNAGCSGGIGGYVSMYTLNPASGALASIGPPVWTYDGDSPGSMTIDPSGKFVYVANPGDPWSPDYGSVSMYSIDATTGALTYTGMLSGNCPGLCSPSSVAVDPSGKFAYVGNAGLGSTGNVSMYAIDATTGALTSMGTITAGGYPQAIAVDPSGKFIYAVTASATAASAGNVPAGNVSMYAIDATTGDLTSTGTIAAGENPVAVAVSLSGKFAYVVNANFGSAGNVSMYAIDAATGALTSTGTIAAGEDPQCVALDPVGAFAYVPNYNSNNVSMYSIDSTTGLLTLIGTMAAGPSPSSITIDPSGQFAYVTNLASNNVSMYSIGATGMLTLIGTIGT